MNFHINVEQKLLEHKLPVILDIPWHFTASAVVIHADHILLIHHKRIGAWLPPGGHLEGNEMPHQAAIREAMEETGVPVQVISSPLPGSTDSAAFFLPQPLCVQSCKAVEKGVELYHVDLSYLCSPAETMERGELPKITKTDHVHETRWIALSDLDEILLAKNVPEIISLATGLVKRATV